MNDNIHYLDEKYKDQVAERRLDKKLFIAMVNELAMAMIRANKEVDLHTSAAEWSERQRGLQQAGEDIWEYVKTGKRPDTLKRWIMEMTNRW